MNQPKLLDTVTNLQSIPQEKLTLLEREIAYLPKGQVGTIVEVYHRENKNHYLIEFADLEGCEYAMATLTAEEILVLNYELSVV
ncbi:MAG: DUF4926 domain-containing protein [Pleurocapsa minor HA4230-MV1]|jgi:hypothetical protein|nr:DUF4926 domain-containing protein [Pleurocapsa minor HA4230-MV1]